MPTTRRRPQSSTDLTQPQEKTTRSTRRKLERSVGNDNIDDANDPAVSAIAKRSEKKDVYGSDAEAEELKTSYVLDGVVYGTYVDFVAAKRQRNEDKLRALGFMDESTKFMKNNPKRTSSSTGPTQRGIKRTKTTTVKELGGPIRKSSRLSGSKTELISLDYYVNDWNRDNSTIVREGGDDVGRESHENDILEEKESFFKGRVNDGSVLSLEDAIDLNDPKWNREESLLHAQALMQTLSSNKADSAASQSGTLDAKKSNAKSPTSVVVGSIVDDDNTLLDVSAQIDQLSIDNEEWVAKVTPDRIYCTTTHPSESKLICCAGDKQGYIGLWDVDAVAAVNDGGNRTSSNHGVSLFRPHSRPICCFEWLTHDSMVTASYDGTIRRLNIENGTFEEIFATYDDSDSTYLEDLGFGLDQGYRYWTQFVAPDPRSKGMSNPSLFITTSFGEVFHVDLRSPRKQMITFHESVSEKKVNTASLHPNETTLATAGNDGVVRLFDIRKFGDNRARSKVKPPKVLCQQVAGLSISSAFFSPSGKSLLTTSFANRLDLTENAHLQTKGETIKPNHSIRHNNQTGRWLTTFQAKWHPSLDIFCCGSMNQPRCMEVFNSQGKLLRSVTGEALSSVMSRTCFHPSTNNLILVGGNSSGRVVAIRNGH